MTRPSMLATKCFAIDTSALKSSPVPAWARSILYAAWSTISFAWYSSMVLSAIIHWMPCFSASSEPWANRLSDRSTIMSSAVCAWAIQRMQCARRAGPSRYWPSRCPWPRPPSIWVSPTRRSSMRISLWPVEPCMVSIWRTSVQPSAGRSTMNAELPAWGMSGLSSVRAMRMANLERCAFEMNHLCPFSTHSSPSG